MSYRSKYDEYWFRKIDELKNGIEIANSRGMAVIDISDITVYGQRKPESWYGKIVICGNEVEKTSIMVHLKSLGRILISTALLSNYDSCFSFRVTQNLKLVIEKIPKEATAIRRQSYTIRNNELYKPSQYKYVFREYPLGEPCVCDPIFQGFLWHELPTVKSSALPGKPGVYVIRVIEKGEDTNTITQDFESLLTLTNWLELIRYVHPRLERLHRIKNCPVIYIGSTDNIRFRYRDLSGIRHTALFPVLALLLGKWKLDYGFKLTKTVEEARYLEEELKIKYRNIHGELPALVEK